MHGRAKREKNRNRDTRVPICHRQSVSTYFLHIFLSFYGLLVVGFEGFDETLSSSYEIAELEQGQGRSKRLNPGCEMGSAQNGKLGNETGKSEVKEEEEEEEPILMAQNQRFCMFPVRYRQLWEMYKKAEASFWTGNSSSFYGFSVFIFLIIIVSCRLFFWIEFL